MVTEQNILFAPSVPPTEHSVVTAADRTGELEAFKQILQRFENEAWLDVLQNETLARYNNGGQPV